MPREVHEHQDPDGNTTGYTVITRESPWDDAMRQAAYALWRHENPVRCPCGCGQPAELTLNPDSVWKVDTYQCTATKAKLIVEAEYDAKWEGKDKPLAVHHYVIPVDPDEAAKNRPQTSTDSTDQQPPAPRRGKTMRGRRP